MVFSLHEVAHPGSPMCMHLQERDAEGIPQSCANLLGFPVGSDRLRGSPGAA
jgi:hypothetical protein